MASEVIYGQIRYNECQQSEDTNFDKMKYGLKGH